MIRFVWKFSFLRRRDCTKLFHDGGPHHIETSPMICRSKSMDWFLYDRGLRYEKGKKLHCLSSHFLQQHFFSCCVVASNFKTIIKTYGCGFSNNLKLFWPFSYRLEQFWWVNFLSLWFFSIRDSQYANLQSAKVHFFKKESLFT